MEENRSPFDHPDSTGRPGGMLLSIFDDVPEGPHERAPVSREDMLAFMHYELPTFNRTTLDSLDRLMGPLNGAPDRAIRNENAANEGEDTDHDDEVSDDQDEDSEEDRALNEVFENDDYVIPGIVIPTIEQMEEMFRTPGPDVNAIMVAYLQNPGIELEAFLHRPTEVVIREALAKNELKKEILLEQMWIAESVAVRELPLEEIKQIHALLTNHQTNPHRLQIIVIEMTKLDNVRKIILYARRFRSKVEQLHDRMDAVSSEVAHNDTWREVEEDNGPLYYINDEGLTRMDPPMEWFAANEEIDRRVAKIQTEIRNIEDFVVDRISKLLYDVHGEKKLAQKLIRKIKKAIEKENLDDAQKNSLIDAQEIVEAVVEKVFDKVIDFFYYSPPHEIPGVPLFGVTNAHSQRRNRENPNFEAELEAYFNAPEENEPIA